MKIILPAAAVVLAGATFVTTRAAYAEEAPQSPITSIVERIAERFSLSTSDVQTVFDEEHQAREAEMQSQYEARLDEAVSNGELTAEQKQLILDKHNELQAERENSKPNFRAMKNMTEEERQANKDEMEAQHQELQDWADQNEIDLKYLMGLGMPNRGEFDGLKGHRSMGDMMPQTVSE